MSRVSEEFGARSRALRALQPWTRVEAIGQTLPLATQAEAEWLGAELLDLISREPVAHPGLHWVMSSRIRPWISKIARAWRPSRGEVALRARRIVADQWTRLPANVRAAASALGGWHEFAMVMATDESPAVRASAAPFIVQAVEHSSWTLLATLLNDSDSRVIDRAERVLLDLVRRVSDDFVVDDAAEARGLGPTHLPMPCSAEDVERVTLASLEQLSNGERRATLVALLSLASPERVRANVELAYWLNVADSPAHVAMKGFLRWTRMPLARQRAWEWLTIPSFANAATDRLSRSTGVEDHEVVLRRSHLLLHPARGAKLGALGIVRPGQLHRPQNEAAEGSPWPGVQQLNAMSVDARRGLARFLEHTKPPITTRDELLSSAINEPDVVARYSAVRMMSPRGVLEFALDRDVRVARCAALRASAIGDEVIPNADDERLWMKLRRSEHAAVRSIAAQECERFFAFDPATAVGMLRLRQRLAVDRDATIAMLRERLEVAPAEAKATVVAAIRRLGLQRELLTELTRALSVPDSRAAATAAAAIGEAPIGALRDEGPLRASLAHTDPRVRANAAAALLKHVPRDDSLIELKNDGHHRVRSTAIRGLFGAHVNAMGSLEAMLHDERPEHRLAGAWLSSRTPRAALAEQQRKRLAELMKSIADRDADPRVRRRAGGALCVLAGSVA